MKNFLTIILLSLCLTSCGEYVRLQKSNDPELKFQAGKNYFQEKKYIKSTTMFEEIVPYYRGTPQAEEVLYLLAESYMGQKDYYSASEYFQAYVRNFLKGKAVDVATEQGSNGSVTVHATCDGLMQRFVFTPI